MAAPKCLWKIQLSAAGEVAILAFPAGKQRDRKGQGSTSLPL
jgi:hypothetical protein